MTTFFAFIAGQILCIILQMARWVDDTRGWGDYLRHRKHQGRHVADAVLATFVWIAWGLGILAKFADKLPDAIRPWVERLPDKPEGALLALLAGGLLPLGVRYIQNKFFASPEPPP